MWEHTCHSAHVVIRKRLVDSVASPTFTRVPALELRSPGLCCKAPHLLSPSLSQPLYFSIHVLQLNSRSLIDLFAINKQITIQAIPTANEAGRLTADLHLSPCSSKSNPPVALQQNTLPQPPFSSCIHFRGITIFPSKLLCPNCFVSTPKFIRHFQRTQRPLWPGKQEGWLQILVSSLHSSKSNHPSSILALQQICWVLSSLSARIPRRLI